MPDTEMEQLAKIMASPISVDESGVCPLPCIYRIAGAYSFCSKSFVNTPKRTVIAMTACCVKQTECQHVAQVSLLLHYRFAIACRMK
jgi:hypothetical protein